MLHLLTEHRPNGTMAYRLRAGREDGGAYIIMRSDGEPGEAICDEYSATSWPAPPLEVMQRLGMPVSRLCAPTCGHAPDRHLLAVIVTDERQWERDPDFRAALAELATEVAQAVHHRATINLNSERYDSAMFELGYADPDERPTIVAQRYRVHGGRGAR